MKHIAPYRSCLTLLTWLAITVAVVPVAGTAHAASFADGFAHLQQNELHDARRAFTDATRSPDAGAEVFYHLGLVESLLDNPGDAAQAYERAVELDPQSPFAYRFRTNLGWALIDSGNLKQGLAHLVAVAEQREEDFAALANVAHALFKDAEDYNRSEAWYARLADRFPAQQGERPVTEMWLREARQNATILKIGIGFEVFRGEVIGGEFRGRDYGPSPSDTSIVLLTQEGNEITIRKSEIRSVNTEPKYKGMGRSVRGARDDRERHVYGVITPQENLQVGQALLQQNNAEAAARQFAAALQKDPTSTEAPYALAVARYGLHQYAEAAELFESCTGDAATEARARYYLVSAYANHLSDLPAALGHALAYVQLPDAEKRDAIDSAAVKIVQGLVEQNRGTRESDWIRTAGLQLDQSEHRRILGTAYYHAGQPGPALRHLGAAAEMGAGRNMDRALQALELCLTKLEHQAPVPPDVTYYRGYLNFASGRMDEAARALQGSGADMRSRTLLAVVRAYQRNPGAARAALEGVDQHALPPPTRRLYQMAEAVLEAPAWYGRDLAARKQDDFAYARVGAINGLGVYSDTNEGDLMPIIVVTKKNGRGRLEVNGNPMFDLFSVISFKEAFDWVENTVDGSFPNQWDTTITFGGLSLYLAKGGDSAGGAIALALCSAVTEQPVLQDVAITGAIRLDGRVEPVGAVPEKVLAAVSKNLRTIILPATNLEDLGELDAELCSRVKFVAVSAVKEARFHAFGEYDGDTGEAYTKVERQFRIGCRYYQLGAYELARRELEAVRDTSPENVSAARLLESIGDAVVGPMQPDALSG